MSLPPPVIIVPGITATYLHDEYPLPPEIIWSVMTKNFGRAALHPDNPRLELYEPARVASGQIFEIAYKELIEELRYNLSPHADLPVPVYPFGYLYYNPVFQLSPPYAEDIYFGTGQIFPVNSSDVHGLLEAWWFEEGTYAPGTHWPHKVITYDAQWLPSVQSTTASVLAEPIIIASRAGAGAYPPGAEIFHVGDFEGSVELPGWNPNDEHAILLPIAGSLRAFAVRDDNPWAVSTGHPFVIVNYPQHECSLNDNACISDAKRKRLAKSQISSNK